MKPKHSTPLFSLAIAMLLSLGVSPSCAAGQGSIVIENPRLRYVISADGQDLEFVDRASGTNYLRPGARVPCALAHLDGKELTATTAAYTNGMLTIRLGDGQAEAVIGVEPHPEFIRFQVKAVRPRLESLVFLNVPLSLAGRPSEPFGACALSLSLQTRVENLPALQNELRASCEAKFGVVGSSAAIVAAPMPAMLPALQQVLQTASELPLCKVAGPWARETPFNHGSYLFNFGSLTESNVTEWIDMAHSVGFTQIDNHGGSQSFFTFGEFALNRKTWPDGWDTYARIVARLHEEGIGSIFHTYAFFIDKHSKYVQPVPDPRLDAFRSFTLAEDLTADAKEVPVTESTAAMTTVTGFFEHNSVVLHVGDELITFGGASKEPPWRFTKVQRGALGTKAAAHARGDKARHLKECFGLFVPDVESTLFTEIAARHAEIVDQCGFDGIYLDAIDGSSILRGNDECWYWADKFVVEIQKHLKKPVGMEMSAMWHHFWQYRTRWQAWDYPQRGQAQYIDMHASGVNGNLLLPLHLGWWDFQSFNPPQIDTAFPEMIQYLGAKLIGWDAGISLTAGLDRKRLAKIPLLRRDAEILRTCEGLRHAGAFDEAAKAKLREPGKAFLLSTNAAGQTRFRRLETLAHVASEPWSLAWKATNAFGEQPLKLRLESLMAAAAFQSTGAVLIADFGTNMTSWKQTAADGVTFSVAAVPDGTHAPAVLLTATNAGKVPRNAAWTRLTHEFVPPLNLEKQQALGLWIEGDGQGELIAVRLESPQHLAYGAIADRYVAVDFTGPRYLPLVETESWRWSNYQWNDGKSMYNAYRETIRYDVVSSVSVWYQNLPPGRTVKCRVGPIKALPMVQATLKNPALTVNGERIEFPVELPSGGWLEYNGGDDFAVFGSNGEPLGRQSLKGSPPRLRAGENRMELLCPSAPEPVPRVKVSVFSQGEEI